MASVGWAASSRRSMVFMGTMLNAYSHFSLLGFPTLARPMNRVT